MNSYNLLQNKIREFPKVNFAFLPTPFEKLENLSSMFNKFNIYIKRDDQTGLAFGGNKARKLEFIMADILDKKANSVVTWAGIQSNWCRQLSAATKKLGIRAVLVLFKKPQFTMEFDGNLLLDYIFDSEIKIIEVEKDKKIMELKEIKEIIEDIVAQERKKGYNPYIAPIGGSLLEGSMSRPFGAIAYLNAFLEIFKQAESKKIRINFIVLATGSGSTQAGLLVGAKILSPKTKIIGISVSEDKETMKRYIKVISDFTFCELNINKEIEYDEIIVFDEYLKEGYGVLNKEVAEAISIIARKEGILLDPIYTGKAMAGMIDLIKRGYFKEGENIIFLHSGGTPALFPYKNKLVSLLQKT